MEPMWLIGLAALLAAGLLLYLIYALLWVEDME
ncbi:MAG: potassium-transporting ATPase subunit F [Pigmentiphaga sp.]|jgi:K+-transporting ATPase KdpF subunit